MKEHNEKEHLALCQKILSEIDKTQLNKIFSYPEMELGPDFLGFLEESEAFDMLEKERIQERKLQLAGRRE